MNNKNPRPLCSADLMTEAERRKGRIASILSTCFGGIPEVMITESAIVIVFTTMLGLSDMFSMMTTAFSGVAYMLMLIPGAHITDRFGIKKTIYFSNMVSVVFMILLACAPFAGSWSKIIVMTCSFGYCLAVPLYVSAWFPLLDTFLRPSDRGPYIGIMRTSWQVVSLAYIMLSGAVIGQNPPIWLLQVIIAVSGLLCIGRTYYINKIPEAPRMEPKRKLNLKIALAISLSNSRLCGFSLYVFFLHMACFATIPLTFIYLKNYLNVPANIVVILSSLVMFGTMAGYYIASRLMDRFGTRMILLVVHPLLALINFILFFCTSASALVLCMISGLLILYGMLLAVVSVIITAEMMALARPGNKPMAMALCGTFYYGGRGISRMLSSFVLGLGILAESWNLWGTPVSRCQTFYLLFGTGIIITLILLLIVPAVNTRRLDYYEP